MLGVDRGDRGEIGEVLLVLGERNDRVECELVAKQIDVLEALEAAEAEGQRSDALDAVVGEQQPGQIVQGGQAQQRVNAVVAYAGKKNDDFFLHPRDLIMLVLDCLQLGVLGQPERSVQVGGGEVLSGAQNFGTV